MGVNHMDENFTIKIIIHVICVKDHLIKSLLKDINEMFMNLMNNDHTCDMCKNSFKRH